MRYMTTEQQEAPKKPSLVDGVFDKITTWAVQGLEATKRGLETSARWLDARAKRVGEVATKLAPVKSEAA